MGVNWKMKEKEDKEDKEGKGKRRKKAFYALLLLSLLLLFACGCQASPDEKAETVPSAEAEESGNVPELEENADASEVRRTPILGDDLMYRDASLGVYCRSGILFLQQEDMLQQCGDPDRLVIYRDDQFFDEIAVGGEDIWYEIPHSGTYWFLLYDAEGNAVDITDDVEGISWPMDS